MLGFFRRKKIAAPEHSVPSGIRLYAVGDIHGRADLLRRLLAQIAADAALAPSGTRLELVFLGDYVDRGYHSREVIDVLRTELPPGFAPVFLRGNHEEVMLRFYDGDLAVAADWFFFGGRETVASYGLPPPSHTVAPGQVRAIQEAFAAKVPLDHVVFLRATQMSYQCGDYIFVHAGMRPGLPLERQLRDDLLFIRSEFLDSAEDFGGMVVHGHTIVSVPEVRHNRIGIDTGAYATARLTCLVLEGSGRRFLQT